MAMMAVAELNLRLCHAKIGKRKNDECASNHGGGFVMNPFGGALMDDVISEPNTAVLKIIQAGAYQKMIKISHPNRILEILPESDDLKIRVSMISGWWLRCHGD
jgi:hypothetical protein